MNFAVSATLVTVLLGAADADPVPVRHIQGSIHGFVVLKDLNDKILASGESTQSPDGDRITSILSLHFKDGSLYQETSVFSQRKVFQLVSYKQIQKGPSFRSPQVFSFDASGRVSVDYWDNGKEKTISDQTSLPADLADGIIPMLLTQLDPQVEATLSMMVSTPKPRLVKLKISAAGQDSFAVGGLAAKATHYVITVDIGGVTGAIAKVVGKQPPPSHVWISAGNPPVFLKSEAPLYEDGPIVRIELASPVWPKDNGISRR
jgi:hypothetical protein